MDVLMLNIRHPAMANDENGKTHQTSIAKDQFLLGSSFEILETEATFSNWSLDRSRILDKKFFWHDGTLGTGNQFQCFIDLVLFIKGDRDTEEGNLGEIKKSTSLHQGGVTCEMPTYSLVASSERASDAILAALWVQFNYCNDELIDDIVNVLRDCC
jgi:hypothetical protein